MCTRIEVARGAELGGEAGSVKAIEVRDVRVRLGGVPILHGVDIDVAARAVSGHGGTIHYGPAEVPGGIFIIVASDPQGALFGLVGPRVPA